MNENQTNQVAAAVARHTAGAVGVGAAVTAQDQWVQLLGCLITAISLAWSIYEKLRAQRNPTPPPPHA